MSQMRAVPSSGDLNWQICNLMYLFGNTWWLSLQHFFPRMTLLIDVQIIPGSLVEQDGHIPSATPAPCLDGQLTGKGFALFCSK